MIRLLNLFLSQEGPVTRNSKEIQEAQPESSETGEVEKLREGPMVPSKTSSQLHKNDRGKVVITQQEECSFEELKKKLKLANIEISKLRKTSRKHAIKEPYFNKMEALWEDKIVSIPELVSCLAQYFTWTVHAIKEARYIRKVNAKLRAGIRIMKSQIEDLKIQLNQLEGHPQLRKTT